MAYSIAQNQYIQELEATLRLILETQDNTSKLTVALIHAKSILERNAGYHVHYPQWEKETL